jgi:hypothetical protein
MLIKILVVLAVLLIVLIVTIAMRPSEFRITRSTRILVRPSAVFPLVNDFRQWAAWSPWEHRDPNMTRSCEGPASGVGAVYRWAGNKEVGEGGITITDSRADESIRMRLEFLKPFKSTNTTEFTFAPEAGGPATNVTWTMTGRNNFMGKAFGLFMDMDRLIGADFEKGLAAMKVAAESQASTTGAVSN